MSEQYHISEFRQKPRQSRNGLTVALLLFLLVVLTLAYANLRGGSGGDGYSDEQNEAFQLAQDVQNWRKRHPSPGNYGQAAIRLTYNNGSVSSWDASLIEEGFDDADGANSTHSEQLIHKEIMKALTIYRGRRDWPEVASLTVVYYSQVQVCGPCKIDMRPWMNDYTRESGKPVAVSIWQHAHFYIGKPGTGAVSTPDDVVEITIKWDKPPAPTSPVH